MTTDIQVQDQGVVTTPGSMILNPAAMTQIISFSNLMAEGKCTVPKHLAGSPADCMAITMQAARWNMDPFAVAQKTHLVNGTIGYEAQLVNAVISSSSAIIGRFHYKYGGDWTVNGEGVGKQSSNQAGVNVNKGTTINPNCWISVGAVLAGESEIQWGEPLFPAAVTTKNSALWKTAPKQQAAYLAVKYWARLYCPQVIMGVYSTDELDSTPAPQAQPTTERVINPANDDAPEQPEYPQDKFDEVFPKWKLAIESNKVTAEGVIAKAETKYPLSSQQKELILGVAS